MNLIEIKISFFRKTNVVFVLLFAIIFFQCNFAFSEESEATTTATTTDTLKVQIQQITDQKSEIQKEIAVYEDQLKEIGDQSASLKNTIKSLDATINKNTLDIKLTQKNIDSAQLQIEQLSRNIDKNIDVINNNVKVIALLINEANKNDNTSMIENFFAYKNFSDFWVVEQDIALIQGQLKNKIYEMLDAKNVFENNKIATEKKKQDLLDYKSNLMDQKTLLSLSKKEKDSLLAETKNSEANYKKMIADKKALADAFDKELALFESQVNFAFDIKSIPAYINGTLSWPLKIVKITQKFGMTDFAVKTKAYKGEGHNGVDFAASIGTKVLATETGLVKGVGDTDTVCPRASFGKWIMLEHENGLSTVYGHLSLIKVKEGQWVNVGDVIGYSGNTGYSTGPHLHISVYATPGVKIMSRKSAVCKGTYVMPIADLRAYLDPLRYLPSL